MIAAMVDPRSGWPVRAPLSARVADLLERHHPRRDDPPEAWDRYDELRALLRELLLKAGE